MSQVKIEIQIDLYILKLLFNTAFIDLIGTYRAPWDKLKYVVTISSVQSRNVFHNGPIQ